MIHNNNTYKYRPNWVS